MHSVVQVQERPPLTGQGLCPWTNGDCRTLNSFIVPVEESQPLIGQDLLAEPMLLAVPELLHVYTMPSTSNRKRAPLLLVKIGSLNQSGLLYLNSSMSTPIPSTSR